MRLFTSNRLETLLDALAAILRQAPLEPLTPEIIVVQSRGMERWLSLQLAQRLGIWAHAEFPFPGKMAWQAFRLILPGQVPDTSAYETGPLSWTILRLLPEHLEDPAFIELKNYLRDDSDGLKIFQLARRLAHLFDQYVIYRPDWVLNWDAGEEEHWQARLWRAIGEDYRQQAELHPERPLQMHRAAVFQRFLQQTEQGLVDTSRLPQRVAVFGISALPPFYIRILETLGRFTEINVFLMNPCRDYWGDIVSDTELSRILARHEHEESAEELYYTRGNRLLASMGKLGRDFLDLLTEAQAETELEGFVEPGQRTLLHCLQSDILNMRDSGEGEQPVQGVKLGDNSLQIHSCHSPLREVEVLHDRLLALFEANAELQPRDILVMAPDIEIYAPFVQAVFATTQAPERRMPFSIADRSLHSDSQLLDSFMSVLALAQSRVTLSEVLSLLESDAVQRRFGLSVQDLETLHVWLDRAGVRWGIDTHSRSDLGLPEFSENTWRFGLDRLLLGYALPGKEPRLFSGIAPLELVEGSDADLLSKLVDFTEQLFALRDALLQAHTPSAWQNLLNEVLDRLFTADREQQEDMLALRRSFAQLQEDAELADFIEPLQLNRIQHWLEQNLSLEDSPLGFISGHVTFCSMLPMRSIPFKVVCLLGLNDRAYPRSQRPPGFDLMSSKPRQGDRSRRNDDRYLFLESLLSARNHFYLSYVGQDIQDNSEIPPSVLITELLEYIAKGCELVPASPRKKDQEAIADKSLLREIYVQHPLQAFSPAYFDLKTNASSAVPPVSSLFSYAEEYCQAGQILTHSPAQNPAFLTALLPEPGEEWQQIELGHLLRFFRNPAQYLLRERLGLSLEREHLEREDQEPIDLDALERYLLQDALVEQALQGHPWESSYPLYQASGNLPPAQVGSIQFQHLIGDLRRFVDTLQQVLNAPALAPLHPQLALQDNWSLHGHIQGLWPAAQIRYRFTALRAHHQLDLWIRHLFLNATAPADYPRESWFISKDELHLKFSPLAESQGYLQDLVDIYRDGLRRPLPLFPESAFAYVESYAKEKDQAKALQKATATWLGSDFMPGERERNLYLQRCFQDKNQLDEEFEYFAVQVFGPLFEHRLVNK